MRNAWEDEGEPVVQLQDQLPPHLPNTYVLGPFLSPKGRGKNLLAHAEMVRI